MGQKGQPVLSVVSKLGRWGRWGWKQASVLNLISTQLLKVSLDVGRPPPIGSILITL